MDSSIVFHSGKKGYCVGTEETDSVPVFSFIEAPRNEKISGGGGVLWTMKYCWPPWLADEENFSFQIV